MYSITTKDNNNYLITVEEYDEPYCWIEVNLKPFYMVIRHNNYKKEFEFNSIKDLVLYYILVNVLLYRTTLFLDTPWGRRRLYALLTKAGLDNIIEFIKKRSSWIKRSTMDDTSDMMYIIRCNFPELFPKGDGRLCYVLYKRRTGIDYYGLREKISSVIKGAGI